MQHLVTELNVEASRLARKVADEVEAETGIPRYVAGVLGPTSKTLSLSPNVNDPGFRAITFDQLAEEYTEAASARFDGGSDIIISEPTSNTWKPKTAIHAVHQPLEIRGE